VSSLIIQIVVFAFQIAGSIIQIVFFAFRIAGLAAKE